MRTAGTSQAAWALLTEGTTAARVEVHRLRHLLMRAMKLVEDSEQKDHIYQVAGDILLALPTRVTALETVLDRTAYALSKMGEEHLRERLPFGERMLVDDAVHKIDFSGPMGRAAHRVALRHMARQVARRYADLTPPLGDFYNTGPCLVIDRIESAVRNPREQAALVDKVEDGDSLTNPEAARAYSIETEKGPGGKLKSFVLGPHAQYRMDLRGVTVPQIRAAFTSFLAMWNVERSRGGKVYDTKWDRGEEFTWVDPRLGLLVGFTPHGKDQAKVMTVYWKGQSDPRPPGDGGCQD